jgi:hypothetical protein
MFILTTIFLALPVYFYLYNKKQHYQEILLNKINNIQTVLSNKNVQYASYEISIFKDLKSYLDYLNYLEYVNSIFENIYDGIKHHKVLREKISMIKKDYMSAFYYIRYYINLKDVPFLMTKIYSLFIENYVKECENNQSININMNDLSPNSVRCDNKLQNTPEVTEDENDITDTANESHTEYSQTHAQTQTQTQTQQLNNTSYMSDESDDESDNNQEDESDDESDDNQDDESEDNPEDESDDNISVDTIVGNTDELQPKTSQTLIDNTECELDKDVFGDCNKYSVVGLTNNTIVNMVALYIYNIVNTLIS